MILSTDLHVHPYLLMSSRGKKEPLTGERAVDAHARL